MSRERYPEGTDIEPDVLRSCGWRSVLSGKSSDGYWAMCTALSAAAAEAVDAGEAPKGRALWLLADVCSMRLQPEHSSEPFQAMWIVNSKRSPLPEDLVESDIAALADVVDDFTGDARLRARIADLLWLVGNPRDVRFALMAIDEYRSLPLDNETWVRDGEQCWRRAARLARSLGSPAAERYQSIESALLTRLETTTSENGYLALWIADLMEDVGMARSSRREVAHKLEAIARESADADSGRRVIEYSLASGQWYEKDGDTPKAATMYAFLAEAWVGEARRSASDSNPSRTVAAAFLENAIQAYRRIPRRERPSHGADERIVELRNEMSVHGEYAFDEMAVVQQPPVDISELVEASREAVKGKPFAEALGAFANICCTANTESLRSEASTLLKEHPLHTFVPAVVIADGGRVVARVPAAGTETGDDSGSEDEPAVWAQMLWSNGIRIGLAVQAHIWPALQQLCLEHWVKERDLVQICSLSAAVPNGRERLTGRALFAGFEMDFSSALHLLVPQVENIVRHHLKARGVLTANLRVSGIENENGLSSLLVSPAVKDIFGDDLAFELKALFTDPLGPNLRNRVAHGLVDDDEVGSVHVVYAWWWCFRLILKTAMVESRGDRV